MMNDTLVIPAGVIQPKPLLLWLRDQRDRYRSAARWISEADMGSGEARERAMETVLLYDHMVLAYNEVIAHISGAS